MRNRRSRFRRPASSSSPQSGPMPPGSPLGKPPTGQHSRPGRRNDPRQPGGHERHEPRGEIIFGVEPVRELIAASPAAIRVLYFKAGAQERFAPEIEAVRASGGQIVSSADAALARMAGSEGRHQGIVATIREYAYVPLEEVLEQKPDPLIVVDGVTDPRNLGAILRSVECAGAKAVVLARDRTAPITPAAVKASAGAWVHLKVARCGNVAQTLEALKAEGYWTVALAPDGDVPLAEVDCTRRLAVVVGAEGKGVRDLVKKTVDFVVNIPMYGRVASLNVSVAAAIALFDLARRRGLEPIQQEAYPNGEVS